MLSALDLRWLDGAADFARPWLGTTAENPTVGAIITDRESTTELGRGVTAPGGRPHAETLALELAGIRAKGATLYVTLEPCNHWGKTPPCVDAVIAAGIARVVCGMTDPDPRTAGKSIAKLKAAGIEVLVPQIHEPSSRLHEGFVSRQKRGRPFVVAKLAVSEDGMIGLKFQGNYPITGEEARRWTHIQRAHSDAIMVGAGTARADHPRLNVRVAGLESRSPRRFVLTRSGQPVQGLDHLEPLSSAEGLTAALEKLAGEGISTLFVEGGAELTDALLEGGLVDRFYLLQSRRSVGAGGVPATRRGSLADWLAVCGFTPVSTEELGPDRLVTFERAS